MTASRSSNPSDAGEQAAAGPDAAGTVVTIGVFDGVHRGHRALLDRAHDLAVEHGLPLTVVTFDPHPMAVVRPAAAPCRLATLEHRTELLTAAGADAVSVVRFDEARSQQSPQDFVADVLVDRLRARAVVTGENFRFGHRAAGDVALLDQLGRQHGFAMHPVELAGDTAASWSSTRIRELVRQGDVATAAAGLTRPHRVEGEVGRGDQRGRQLGFPTANVSALAGSCIPADGVYAAFAGLPDGRSIPAAVSVGANTTFGGSEPRIEAYLLDGDDWQLYDQHLVVDFVARIRGMVTFGGVDELIAAMTNDVRAARRLLSDHPGDHRAASGS